MFLPYFIALFLGLVSPSETSNYQTNTEMVSTSNNDPGETIPGDDDGTGDTGGGTGGGSTGGGVGGGSTAGENGHVPPPNP
ncbi:hypothetical protein [Pedobacter cryotolerans]|uniref:Uncharacterized protein n=1 Tax=Pedobacter cryotolerans TaxID=2571270 RepID=A0A4U1CD53_9SPHI|nr:hypothetical protein [Pedobacter cryotolerans]TKC03187.1 hypothetical protein FA045_01045 [Pedobacter cryotolerans]